MVTPVCQDWTDRKVTAVCQEPMDSPDKPEERESPVTPDSPALPDCPASKENEAIWDHQVIMRLTVDDFSRSLKYE